MKKQVSWGKLLVALVAVCYVTVVATASADSGCVSPGVCSGGCGPDCPHTADACHECGKQCGHGDLQVCTVMVPANVLETRVKTSVVKEVQDRQETYTVFQLKPVTRKYEKNCCYLKHEVKSKMITEEKCHLVDVPVERTYEVKTYQPECREVIPADTCGECPPQLCEVMVESREQRTETCNEVQVAMEKTKKEIFYCVKEPTPRKVPCMEETTFELVPIEKTRMVSVCVPKVVRTPVDVMVCKEIPKTIVCCSTCAKKFRN